MLTWLLPDCLKNTRNFLPTVYTIDEDNSGTLGYYLSIVNKVMLKLKFGMSTMEKPLSKCQLLMLRYVLSDQTIATLYTV